MFLRWSLFLVLIFACLSSCHHLLVVDPSPEAVIVTFIANDEFYGRKDQRLPFLLDAKNNLFLMASEYRLLESCVHLKLNFSPRLTL